MKLFDITPSANYGKINKILESRFNTSVDFSTLSIKKARLMSNMIEEHLNKIRKSHKLHEAEKNPVYMEMLLVNDALGQFIKERIIENRKMYKIIQLQEGETEHAEVLLAAKDMVDKIQDMTVTLSKMIHEELPPLVDAIRDEYDSGTAEQFQISTSTTLSSALEGATQARNEMDSATRSLSGEGIDQIGMDPMGGDELDLGMGGEPELDMGPDMGPDLGGDPELDLSLDPDTDASTGAIGGPEVLGREER